MAAYIHLFALLDPYSAVLSCGDFREGDGWTALPQSVTCPECRRRIEANATSRPSPEVGAEPHAR